MQKLEEKDYTEEELRRFLFKMEEEYGEHMAQIRAARREEEEDERAVYRAEAELEQMRDGCGADDRVIKGLLDKKSCILADLRRKRADFLDELKGQSKAYTEEYEEETERIHHSLRRQIYKKKDGG